MKNVVKNIMLSVLFALTMVFVSGVNVSAADTYTVKQNMNVESNKGSLTKIDLEAGGLSKETVYVVQSDETELKLTYIERSEDIAAFTSEIAVVKCYKVARGSCTSWKGYEVSSVNVDQLRADGFVLKLNGFDGAKVFTGVVNGTALSSLNSSYYDLETMIFVLIKYEAVETYWGMKDWKLGNHTRIVAQYAEAIPLLNIKEANGKIAIDSDVTPGNIDVTIESTVRLTNIKYIATTAEVNFDDLASAKNISILAAMEEYAKDNVLTLNSIAVANDYLESAIISSNRKGSAFLTEATITMEDGMIYYVYAEDEVGNYFVSKISDPGTDDDNDNIGESGSEDHVIDKTNKKDKNSNAKNTGVGEIILIVLVAILVISAVLVVAQKIFDHKRKLY